MQIQPKFRHFQTNVFWEFFYELIFRSPISGTICCLLNLWEKLLLLSLPADLLFHGSKFESLADFFANFSVLTYFSSDSSVVAFVLPLFCLFQLVLCLAAYRIVSIKQELATEAGWETRVKSPVPSSGSSSRLLNYCVLVTAKVLLQVCSALAAFFVRIKCGGDDELPDEFHVHIPVTTLQNSAWLNSFLALSLLLWIEVLGVCVLRDLFCHNRGLNCVYATATGWSSNSKYFDLYTTFLYSTTQIALIAYPETTANGFFLLALAALWTIHVILFIRYVKWHGHALDLWEFFFALLLLSLYLYLCYAQFEVNNVVFTQEKVLAFPVLVVLACAIRHMVVWNKVLAFPRTEEEAVELLQQAVKLLSVSGPVFRVNLVRLLNLHRTKCEQNAECECRGVEGEAMANPDLVADSSHVFSQGARGLVLKLLLSDLHSLLGTKSMSLRLAYAEIQFHCFPNLYHAWAQAVRLLHESPALAVRQRIYNLVKSIDSRISEAEDAAQEDTARLVDSIAYVSYYNKFLDQVGDAIELTVGFWKILIAENLSPQALNETGKRLFSAKYEVSESARRISRISSNHIEFLARYGLFVRYIMHDSATAEEVFSKIASLIKLKTSSFARHSAEASFAAFRDCGEQGNALLMIAQADCTGDCALVEVNTELEQALDYTRTELAGCSVTNLMSPVIAKCHSKLVHEFFQSMDASLRSQATRQFLRSKNGTYLPCNCILKNVPNIMSGLYFVFIAVPIRAAAVPTGTILCDENLSIIGFAKEVAAVLGLAEQVVTEWLRNARIQDLFPELADPKCIEKAASKDGTVVLFAQGETQESQAEKSLEPVTVAGFRVFMETEEYAVTALQLVEKMHIFTLRLAENEDKNIGREGLQLQEKKERAAQIASLPSVSTRKKHSDRSLKSKHRNSSAAGTAESQRRIRTRKVSKGMSAAIKKLYAIIVGALLCIAGLIWMSAWVSLVNLDKLTDRFELVKAYMGRYKAIMSLTAEIKSYAKNLARGDKRFNSMLRRCIGRLDMIVQFNEDTRKLLFSQGLDYDFSTVTIPDWPEGNRTTQFSHALLIMINTISRINAFGFYNVVSGCLASKRRPNFRSKDRDTVNITSDKDCQETLKLTDYAFNVSFGNLRPEQDIASLLLLKDLDELTASDSATQYALIGVSAGLVLLTTIVIAPIFVMVIRNKCRVFRIFALISPEEVQAILKQCRGGTTTKDPGEVLELARSCKGRSSNVFWRRLADIAELKACERSITKQEANAEEPGEKEKKEHADEAKTESAAAPAAVQAGGSLVMLESPESIAKKKLERLSEAEYTPPHIMPRSRDLRNKSIIRLALSMCLFLIHAGVNTYFTYLLHSVNRDAIKEFFGLNYRSIYATTMSLFLREAITSGDKSLISHNDTFAEGEHKTDLGEIIDQLRVYETESSEFKKHATEAFYKSYLRDLRRADGQDFCAVSNSFNYSQGDPCEEDYNGPMGLGSAMAYLIDFYTKYSVKVLNTNFSDSDAASELRGDQDPTRITSDVTTYLTPVFELLTLSLYNDMSGFFELSRALIYVLASCFFVLFAGIYLMVFLRFIGTLKGEIGQTQELVNMIPEFVLEANAKVREQVWLQKGVAQYILSLSLLSYAGTLVLVRVFCE